MKIRILALTLVLCLLLGGCSNWMDGSYSSVNAHQVKDQHNNDQITTVSTFNELRKAMVELVESGAESSLINISKLKPEDVQRYMEQAVMYTTKNNPVGAYAVNRITYEKGTHGGQQVMSVKVEYNHRRSDISKIKQASGMSEVRQQISTGLKEFESRLIIRVAQYRETDLVQFVEDYADENPDVVMELPQVTVNMYPESGSDRVVELVFTYQSSRESLRSMQSRVRPLFTSAELYVSGNYSDQEKYTQLYAFLMERNEYKVDTSITPSYSLLIHGVGDSKAFAVVYSAMCRRAGLECMVVSGTKDGESLFWNMICFEGVYYHVDLLQCNRDGMFQLWTDAYMTEYVWDYSAYPKSVAPEPEPTEPEVPTDPTEPTEPDATEVPTEPEI